MATETVTIKVYPSSRKILRIVSAMKGESHLETIQRLLLAEQKKLEKKKK